MGIGLVFGCVVVVMLMSVAFDDEYFFFVGDARKFFGNFLMGWFMMDGFLNVIFILELWLLV